jgi:hypothetical protein
VGNNKNDNVTDLYIYYTFTIILAYTPTYKKKINCKTPSDRSFKRDVDGVPREGTVTMGDPPCVLFPLKIFHWDKR